MTHPVVRNFSRAPLGRALTRHHGDRALYVMQMRCEGVGGMGLEEGRCPSRRAVELCGALLSADPRVSRRLLAELMEHATRDEFVYTHEWAEGDLALWDNRGTIHRVLPYSSAGPRVMRRCEWPGVDEDVERSK